MTTYIFYIRGKKLKISHETFWFIEQRAKREIPLKFYEYVIRNDPNVQKFKEETGIAWRTLYVWILSAYENKEYKLLWWKVLAVKSYVYREGRGRHIECRFLTDAPDQIAETDEFSKFCESCLDLFMECAGYVDLIMHCNQYYFGVQKVEEFEDTDDRKVPFYVEVYDYEYKRYPYYAEGHFSPFYWTNYTKAIKEFEDQACAEAMLVQPWKYESELEKHVSSLFGSPKQRHLED